MAVLTIVFETCVGFLQLVLEMASLAGLCGLCWLYVFLQRTDVVNGHHVGVLISFLAGGFSNLAVLFFPSWLGGASRLGDAQNLPICFTAAGLGIWTWQAARTLYRRRTVHRWPFVAREIKGEELEKLKSEFEKHARQFAGFYHFGAQLVRAYRVQNPNLEQRLDDFSEGLRARGKTSNKKRLYHGTSVDAAYNIVRRGFKLPTRAGMFGKGIYFAPCPQKSIQYMGGAGLMLLCDVEVGNPRVTRSAWNQLEPEQDLRRGWFARAVGMLSFDSVEASAGFLGCVRVSESIVYAPEQAAPYAVLVIQKTKTRNGT